jgi:CxxC-x17-CxxC domain-containing protein
MGFNGGFGGGQRRSGFGGNRGGGFRRGGGFNRGPREMHEITCKSCGKKDQVPFKPRDDKDVFCKDCYFKSKGIEPRQPFNNEAKAESKPVKAESEDEMSEDADEMSEESDEELQ